MSGIKELKSKLNKLDNAELEWGFLGGNHSKANMSYASLAWLLEEGSRSSEGGYNIPPRPAFKQLLANMRTNPDDYERHVAKAYKSLLEGTSTYQHVLKTSGEYVTDKHQYIMENWITEGNRNQHNARLTIELKGFDRPFVDTGELIRNVTYQIKQ